MSTKHSHSGTRTDQQSMKTRHDLVCWATDISQISGNFMKNWKFDQLTQACQSALVSIQLNSCQLKVRPALAACQFSPVSQHANIQTFDNSIETLRWMFPQTFNLSFQTLYLTSSSSVCRIVWADGLKCWWSFNRYNPQYRSLHSPVIGLIRPILTPMKPCCIKYLIEWQYIAVQCLCVLLKGEREKLDRSETFHQVSLS